MKAMLPQCCPAQAFTLLAKQLAHLESPEGLLNGAVAIAMHRMGEVDVGQIEQTLQSYVDTVRSRVRGSQPQALLAHLHEFLFEELGFTGSTDDYYDPTNSYLPAVLENKRGLPITLSLIYKIVAERLGMDVWGVGLPGHFLVGMNFEGTRTLIDPFCGGQLVTEEEGRAAHPVDLRRRGRVVRATAGADAEPALADADAPEPAESVRVGWVVQRCGGDPGDGDAALAGTGAVAAGFGAGAGADRNGAAGVGLAGYVSEEQSG